MSELSTEPIIQAYFNQENILSKHQLESYDDFIENILPNILNQFSPIVVNMNDSKIKCIKIKNNWMEIDTPQDYSRAQKFFK